jgi:hypothetical protein
VAIIRVRMDSNMEALEGTERRKNVMNMYLEDRVSGSSKR